MKKWKWLIFHFFFVCLVFFQIDPILIFSFSQFSPSCTFLTCVHRTSFNQNSNTALISEEVGDVEYRLRTGEVVDEAPYPIVPHMRNEEARLRTFSSWPNRTPVRPRDLAQAGFFYVGQSDKVQCFCCGGRLNGWEPGDSAWSEHSKHYPNCYFILGHDVGNIPIQTGIEEDASNNLRANDPALMQNFEARRATFAGVRHPINHERLARAGFYSTGNVQVFEAKETLCNILKCMI